MEHEHVGVQPIEIGHNGNSSVTAADNRSIDHLICIPAGGALRVPPMLMAQQTRNNTPVLRRPPPDQRYIPGKINLCNSRVFLLQYLEHSLDLTFTGWT